MSSRERRDERRAKSTARRRAEDRGSGFETSLFNMPDGLNFFKLAKGRMRISILGYKVGKGNPYADEGEIHYERTFYTYRKIGADEKSYVAPGKTCGHKDFIQEYRQKKARDKSTDADELKALDPKERQAFLVYDHEAPERKLQLWEVSFHSFGKLLDARVKSARGVEKYWDMFYFPDEDGFILELDVEDTGTYGLQVKAIDFEPREKNLPDEIVNHGICLDDILRIPTYDELKAKFLCLNEGEGDEDARPPAREERKPEDRKDERRREEPKQEEPKREPPKEEPKKQAVASDFGIERDSAVMYEGKRMVVVKVSGDGTSLTLINEATDDVVRAVAPNEVKLIKDDPPPKREEPRQEERREAPKESPKRETVPPFEDNKASDPSTKEDDWDRDWSA